MYSKCMLCPRKCGADRTTGVGACGVGSSIRIARVGLHEWEEPCISYGKGSGTIFFSGCSLKCVFCQNYKISAQHFGTDVSADTLADEMLRLQDMGAVNINLVTPTHFAYGILKALDKVKHRLSIPVCFNCGGYELTETLAMFDEYADIYMPDIKYFSPLLSKKYSGAADYFEKASAAVAFMHKSVGYADFDGDGHMRRGVLVRHLVLPSLYADSLKILDYLAENYDTKKIAISLMRQYFPTASCASYPEINRKLTTLEYRKVTDYAVKLGFTVGFTQEKSSAFSHYVPAFDYKDRKDSDNETY